MNKLNISLDVVVTTIFSGQLNNAMNSNKYNEHKCHFNHIWYNSVQVCR